MTLGESVYHWARIVLLIIGLIFDIFIIWWIFSMLSTRYIDTQRPKGRGFSWRELLPGPAGRRARVERKHLVIMGPHYKRRPVKVTKKLFPFKLHKMMKR